MILVVDDDDDVRLTVSETLEDLGYDVAQAASGEEALRRLAEDVRIRLLVTDVRMPGMSGLELADAALVLRQGLRIILISGYFLPQKVSQRFLKKPFHMRELAAAVRTELGC